MKKLIAMLAALSLSAAGTAGVFAEAGDPTGMEYNPDTEQMELVYDEDAENKGGIGTVYEAAKEYLDEHAGDVINKEKDLSASIDDLVSEGILQGFPDGDYHTDENVTRAQMAVFIARLLYGPDYSKRTREELVRAFVTYAEGEEIPQEVMDNYAPEYSDLSEEHWAFTELTALSVLPTPPIEGYGDGTIRPDNNITYTEAAAMLLRAMGYGPFIDEHGGYPGGVEYWAEDIGLFGRTNAAEDLNAAAPRGDIIIMISTALDSLSTPNLDENCVRTEELHQGPWTWRQERVIEHVGEYDQFYIPPAA